MQTTSILDMAAALAVTALLAQSYGVLQRRFVGAAWAPAVLGVLFGVMAVAQMRNPVEPYDGLFIDLRNIPIALAGAFLGWRGLLPCLLIVAAVRIDLGGIGTAAGVWSMVIAGLAGMIWARKMAHVERRTLGMLVMLALAMSLHLLGALALPREMALVFFTEAAGPILLINLMAVPLIGQLLERENRRIAYVHRMTAARGPISDPHLLPPDAFARDMANAYAARTFGTFSGFVRITPISGPVGDLFATFRAAEVPFVDRTFLAQHLEHGELACQAADGSILIPLSDLEIANPNRITGDLRQALRAGGAARPARSTPFELQVIPARDPARFLRMVESASEPREPRWNHFCAAQSMSPLRPGEKSRVRRARVFDRDIHEGLFAKAEFLMDRNHV